VHHARLDPAREVIAVDLTRERVKDFPGFDKNAFDTLSHHELMRLDNDPCRTWEELSPCA
jgi:hypothetical protein